MNGYHETEKVCIFMNQREYSGSSKFIFMCNINKYVTRRLNGMCVYLSLIYVQQQYATGNSLYLFFTINWVYIFIQDIIK